MAYELYYWPQIQGRGEFVEAVVRLMGAVSVEASMHAPKMTTLLSAAFAILASIAAFVSARYWLRSSLVGYLPPSAEPGDETAALYWRLAGLLQGAVESSTMNWRAARWSALAAGLYGVSGILSTAPTLWPWIRELYRLISG